MSSNSVCRHTGNGQIDFVFTRMIPLSMALKIVLSYQYLLNVLYNIADNSSRVFVRVSMEHLSVATRFEV